MILPHASLRLLARLKLRGLVRKQTRRLKGPKNILFLVLGVLLMGSWLVVLAAPSERRGMNLSQAELRTIVELGCAAIALLAGTTALSHRGLYLPAAEIEVLLAAPVSRRDLVRYRILSGLGRTLLGGLVVGLMVSRHMPNRAFGILGAFSATLTTPILGQGLSLLAGGAENRLANRFAKLPMQLATFVVGLSLLAFVILLTLGSRRGAQLTELGLTSQLVDLLGHPTLQLALTPFRPWANVMMAQDLASFWPWFAACWGIWFVALELVARIPVDFRELSLSTSSDVAKRLRRGGRRSVGKLSKRAALRRLPWLFGRSPFGAIAWRKANSISRKARGTLLTGAVIIGALTLVSTLVFDGRLSFGAGESVADAVFAPVVIAMIGTIYLCVGLRLDFREDLDQMAQIKAWPIAPWRVFLATLVPEVALVTGFVLVGMALQVSFSGDWHPAILLVAAVQPFAVLIWTSIDNVVFLLSPIRYTPGQEGALNHTGRALLLTVLRILVLALASLGFLAAVGVAWLAQRGLGFDERVLGVLSLVLCALVLVAEVVFLVWAGGRAFRRFDVARDRG